MIGTEKMMEGLSVQDISGFLDSMDAQQHESLMRRQRGLPDLDLGVKASFTTRQWRQRERSHHLNALKTMQSPLAMSIQKHRDELQRSQQILEHGASNKAKALEMKLKKIREHNEELSRRLVKVQNTPTEITMTNMPQMQRHIKAANERQKYLATARTTDQRKVDMENSLILKRLVNTRSTVKPKNQMEEEFRRHMRIRKNMCKLAVPPHEIDRMLGKRKRKRNRRPHQLPSLNATASNNDNHHHHQLIKPISRSKPHTLSMPNLQKTTKVKSNQDRGQICQTYVDITYICPGKEPVKQPVLLICFKSPKDDNLLLFEVTTESFTRYAQVSYDQMRAALEQNPGHPLATVAATRLTLFGEAKEDIVLVWNDMHSN